MNEVSSALQKYSFMKFTKQAKPVEPSFQVLAPPGLESHPHDPDKKLCFCMAETLPQLGSPFGIIESSLTPVLPPFRV